MGAYDLPDGESVEPWLEALVAAGDARAMVCVGDAHDFWRPDEARHWYRRAAELGDAEAMWRLAGLSRDPDEAHEWSVRAAEAGQLEAMRKLGASLDGAAGSEWWRRAAAAGDPEGMLRHGQALRRAGEHDEARRWGAGAAAAMDQGWLNANFVHQGADKLVEALVLSGRDAQDARREADDRLSRVPGVTGGTSVEAVVATAVVVTALVPFVQTLAQKAAEDTYVGVRRFLRRTFAKRAATTSLPSRNWLLILQDPDPDSEVELYLWTDTPEASIEALRQLDVEGLIRSAEEQGVRKLQIHWSQAQSSWQPLRE